MGGKGLERCEDEISIRENVTVKPISLHPN